MVTIPPGGMPAAALPQPSAVELADGLAMGVGNPARQGFWCGLRDSQVRPQRWTMIWTDIPAAAANAVRAHYRDHVGPFLWRCALRAATETWQHAGEPEIVFQPGQQRASARAVLELLPAYQ